MIRIDPSSPRLIKVNQLWSAVSHRRDTDTGLLDYLSLKESLAFTLIPELWIKLQEFTNLQRLPLPIETHVFCNGEYSLALPAFSFQIYGERRNNPDHIFHIKSELAFKLMVADEEEIFTITAIDGDSAKIVMVIVQPDLICIEHTPEVDQSTLDIIITVLRHHVEDL